MADEKFGKLSLKDISALTGVPLFMVNEIKEQLALEEA